MEQTGNKGEWSELYAFFKLLADKELCAGDANLNKIKDLIYPIISIIRHDVGNDFHYGYNEGNVVIKSSQGKVVNTIPIMQFKKNAELLLVKINKGKGAFDVPEITDFRKQTSTEYIKSPSTKKADITIVVHDNRTGTDPTLSFSIKSQLGSPATLLNSSQNTNFIFRLSQNIPTGEIERLNGVDGQTERMKIIADNGASLIFEGIQESKRTGDMYLCNLQNIDSSIPEIMANLVLIALSEGLSCVKDVIERMTENNPLGFNMSHGHTYYETKMKRLLTDTALGMKPGELWNGRYEANGGYLVVREDGEVVCYHIYNKNEFEDYIYNNVKIDYPSRLRHDYGYVYEENGKQKMKLNFQIRFIK